MMTLGLSDYLPWETALALIALCQVIEALDTILYRLRLIGHYDDISSEITCHE